MNEIPVCFELKCIIVIQFNNSFADRDVFSY